MPADAPEREASRDLIAALALPALLLALTALMGADAYELRLLALAGVYAVLVLGYQLIFGHAGAISLAQGAFFGLGAYGAALLALRFNLDLALTLPAAAALAALAAAVAATPVLRLKSHTFALATLALQQLAWIVAVNWEGMTGGANGLAGVPGAAVAGIPIPRGWPLALLAWGLFTFAALVVRRLVGGVIGLGLPLMRENPVAAAASGLDVGARRFAVFTASAALGGAAGSLYPHTLGTVSPEVVDFPIMVACLTMTVVGGRRRILGAALGALLLVHLPEWLRVLEGQYLLAYGIALLATILFAPEGLADLALRALGPAKPAPIPAVAPSTKAQSSSTPLDGPLLEIADLSKRFGGVEALTRVSLDVRPGEIVGLIGPNGSGKTTLLNLVGGQEQPDGGRIAFAGRDLDHLSPHGRARLGIARSFQTPSLAPSLSALDNVALAFRNPGAGLVRAREEAASKLAACGLLDMAALPSSRLGPAQMRRVEIARALMRRPRLLLLDEPAAGLSPNDREELAALLRRLAASGMALLVVEHDMGFILPLADRIACLDAGRLIALGTPAEIAADPAVIAVYLGREA